MADLTEAIAAAHSALPYHDRLLLQQGSGVPMALRIAVEAAAPIIERQIRAELAEAIAQLLDDLAEACGEDEEHFKVAYSIAAQVARIKGAHTHTQPAETPGQDRKDS